MQAQLPSVEELRARMANLPLRPLSQNTFYRDSPVAAYALYGTGPLMGLNRGGRYSPKGSFPVLYFAADRLQAQLEAAHHINRHLPYDPGDEIRLLHNSLSSSSVTKLQGILREMAGSEEGYIETESIKEYFREPIVQKLFKEDPARLQVFLELGPHVETPLRCKMDSSRLSLSVNITARGVLDLNVDKTLQELGIKKEDLVSPTELWERATSEDCSLTQRIGLAACEAPGIDGILAPTALSKANLSGLVTHPVNLMLFMHEVECHLPRSSSVRLDTEDEFIKCTDLFWTHRPKWLIDALERHVPELASILKRVGRRLN